MLVTGLVLLGIWGGALIQGTISSRAAVNRFESDQPQPFKVSAITMSDPTFGPQVDFSLWSAKRVDAYKQSLANKVDRPLAVVRVPKIHLEVPLYNDTDDLTLNRGVGRILGTARVGEAGNLGIAGHRDGFFRGLKELGPGDEIDLLLPEGSAAYVVDKTQIVYPEDVWVLNSTDVPTLTLVTCFPFYYVGSAPQRFVVHASLKGFSRPHQQSKSAAGKISTKENER
jgi:sortase A